MFAVLEGSRSPWPSRCFISKNSDVDLGFDLDEGIGRSSYSTGLTLPFAIKPTLSTRKTFTAVREDVEELVSGLDFAAELGMFAPASPC